MPVKKWQERVIVFSLSLILALFSTAVMGYLSMATIIGPWVAPVIVLVAMVFLMPVLQQSVFKNSLAVIVVASSLGGIISTAIGFSFPALYFLNQEMFNVWMSNPLMFCCFITFLVLSAGSLGFVIAYVIKDYLIVHKGLRFPVGKLVYDMIYMDNQRDGIYTMMSGMTCSLSFNVIITRFSESLTTYMAALNMAPLLLSIGFVAGHVIAIPMLVGMLSRMFVLDFVRTEFFNVITEYDFIIAFCSGIVLSTVLMNAYDVMVLFYSSLRSYRRLMVKDFIALLNINQSAFVWSSFSLGVCFIFLSLCQFYFVEQIYLIIFASLAAYYMTVSAGSIGIAQIGRFATFVILPAMYFFDLSYFHVIVVSTFVSVCSGVVVDLLFGYKLAQLANLSYEKIVKYQVCGFIISAVGVGFVFWFYINHFGLGTPELFAQKAQARSLLIQLNMFDYTVVGVGVLYGLLLNRFGIAPLIVFGGVILPSYMVGWLVLAGAVSYLVADQERHYPFWFGLYAMHAVFMMIQALFSFSL